MDVGKASVVPYVLDRRLSKISVTSITQGSEIFNYDKFTMSGYKSGTNSQYGSILT